MKVIGLRKSRFEFYQIGDSEECSNFIFHLVVRELKKAVEILSSLTNNLFEKDKLSFVAMELNLKNFEKQNLETCDELELYKVVELDVVPLNMAQRRAIIEAINELSVEDYEELFESVIEESDYLNDKLELTSSEAHKDFVDNILKILNTNEREDSIALNQDEVNFIRLIANSISQSEIKETILKILSEIENPQID